MADRIRQRKTEQINFRVDEATRDALEEIKATYGYSNDADAIRGLIILAKNQERLIAEIEGRVINKTLPILDSKMMEFFQSDEFKGLVLQIVLDGLTTVPE
jgi:hypothetical protein